MEIPFNWPKVHGKELDYLAEVIAQGKFSGNGNFTDRCQELLKTALPATNRVLLTHSGTGALEMASLLLNIGPGDEVIMPSFTFVSTGNAFVLRGATPVFADIRQDTLNLDEAQIEELITNRTRAIVPVHYAGVGCNMDVICALAKAHNLMVIEDAAQALGATYRGQPLGTFGQLGCFSFHETKNVISGEGGALSINDSQLVYRAEIIWEKGTNRVQFYRGEIDRYTWLDVGSSFLPAELVAAFLLAQLEHLQGITTRRVKIWNFYHELLAPLEQKGLLQRPTLPADCQHNGHLYWILIRSAEDRPQLIGELTNLGINVVSHYVPLHSSPAGRKFGRAPAPLPITEYVADRLIRLPLHLNLTAGAQERVYYALKSLLG